MSSKDSWCEFDGGYCVAIQEIVNTCRICDAKLIAKLKIMSKKNYIVHVCPCSETDTISRTTYYGRILGCQI